MDDASLNFSKKIAKKVLSIPDFEKTFRPTKATAKSCYESSKVLGLFWGLYALEDQRKIEKHILSCTFCQEEHLNLTKKDQQVKKAIPKIVLTAEANASLYQELTEVSKNTFKPSVGRLNNALDGDGSGLIEPWKNFTKHWQKAAFGIVGLSLVTIIFLIPWL